MAIRHVFGENGAIVTADATEAGLRQALKFASLPVLFDEMEPGEDPRKAAAVLALARRASSGSVSLRGSAGHVEHEFTVRSTFLFSSILLPPLTGAERSRIAVLDVMPLNRHSVPAIKPALMQNRGAKCPWRMSEQEGPKALLNGNGHCAATNRPISATPSAREMRKWANRRRACRGTAVYKTT